MSLFCHTSSSSVVGSSVDSCSFEGCGGESVTEHDASRTASRACIAFVSMADTSEWPSARVRSTFLEFFASRGHEVVSSSPCVPHDDPTLLFANAGMNQFKPIFLGQVDPKSPLAKLKRAADTQKCIRAGGKHNDLEDVGKDNYHHTFFEMLGNWSFGDYFKAEAIGFSWELLVKVYKLPEDRLYATYFGGDEALGLPPDTEAKEIWERFLPPDRVLPFGCKDNFWEMGEQGPCGPCSEIHFDRIGGRNIADLVNADDPTCIEIWNIVFIQFNREADGSLKLLPEKHVDTGMGFERITSVLQGKLSNYDTDIFLPFFDAIQKVTGADPYTGKFGKEDVGSKDMAYRVIADHIRTLTFAIADGSRPGNEGREYVLRRVLRRAVRFGNQNLNAELGFFSKLVDAVADNMGDTFPELIPAKENVKEIIAEEEKSFGRTLGKGIERFKKMANALLEEGKSELSGDDAFLLWDTYGFPVDLTELMAEESDMSVDIAGFEVAMERAREIARASRKGTAGGLKVEAEATSHLQKAGVDPTLDELKYTYSPQTGAKVEAIYCHSGFVKSTDDAEGDVVGILLDKTTFYAEQGGQIGDTGVILAESGVFDVQDCQVAAGYVLHLGKQTSGSLSVGDCVKVTVDYERRGNIVPNHTCTHLLNYALLKVLGTHVEQKGSIVRDDLLRFDFSNNGPVEAEKLASVEKIVQDQIKSSLPVYKSVVPLEAARKVSGLRAVFGEVYPDPVRVVSVGKSVDDLLADPENRENFDYSIEFCGGVHLDNTEEATAFVIISEEGIAKGTRRIVAMTGKAALQALETGKALKEQLSALQAGNPAEPESELKEFPAALDRAIISAVTKAELRAGLAALQRKALEIQKAAAVALKQKVVEEMLGIAAKASQAGKSHCVAHLDARIDTKAVSEAANASSKANPELSLLILSKDDGIGKVLCYAVCTKQAIEAGLKAGDWVKATLAAVDGKGGGKPAQAQGQGTNVAGFPKAFQVAEEFASAKMQSDIG